MALHAGEGVGVPQDWGNALDLLVRSAELGWPLAQASLAGLAGDWALARELMGGNAVAPDWKRAPRRDRSSRLVRGAEVRDRLRLAPRRASSKTSPRPRSATGSSSAHARGSDRRRCSISSSGGPAHEAVRDNSECHFGADDGDLILQFLRSRIAAVTELFVPGLEAPAVLHYTPGQRFLPHYDYPR